MVKNYTCKKTIEPPIEWYNQSLWDDNTYLYKNLCGDGDTSSLETNQMIETDVLNESNTSNLEDDSDITSMDNQTELDELIDSVTSESKKDSDITSMDNQEELDKFIDSITSESKKDSDITSMDNQEELDKLIDSVTSGKESVSKSNNLNLSVTSDEDFTNLDVISATSFDETPQNKPFANNLKAASSTKKKKAASSTKKKKAASSTKKKKAASSTKKKKTASSTKKKKTRKNENLDLQGGSSSLTNTHKSILGRF